jgi:hypothetical protein
VTTVRRSVGLGIGAGVAVGVAILLLFAFCRRSPTPLPEKERAKLDSLKATKPAFDSSHTATGAAIVNVVTKIVHDDAAIARIRAEADHERGRADSLSRAAAASRTAADSAERWHLAYAASSREAAGLRVAVDTLERDLKAANDTLGRAKIQLDADSSRIAEHVKTEADLRRDLEHASPPCSVLYVFGCPSRKTAFLVGAGAGALGAYASTHTKQVKDAVGKVTSLLKGAIP